MGRFEGQVAVVTGGGRGLGRAVAQGAAKRGTIAIPSPIAAAERLQRIATAQRLMQQHGIGDVAAMVDHRGAARHQRQRAEQCRVTIDPDHMQTVSETPRPAIAMVHAAPISARALGAGAPSRNGALRPEALNDP